jgi:hypothetical protein
MAGFPLTVKWLDEHRRFDPMVYTIERGLQSVLQLLGAFYEVLHRRNAIFWLPAYPMILINRKPPTLPTDRP